MDGFNSVFVCSFYSVNVWRAEGVTHGGRERENLSGRRGREEREKEGDRMGENRGRKEGKRERLKEEGERYRQVMQYSQRKRRGRKERQEGERARIRESEKGRNEYTNRRIMKTRHKMKITQQITTLIKTEKQRAKCKHLQASFLFVCFSFLSFLICEQL